MSELAMEKPSPTETANVGPVCRFCGTPLHATVVDLGMSPLCESYLRADQLNQMEPFYPLHVYVCDHCFLVQLEQYVSAGAHLHRIRVLLFLCRHLAATRQTLYRCHGRALRLRQ